MKKNLPDYVRDDEKLRQTLLAQEGFMKYVAKYIMNGGEDGLSLYAKYQEYVYADYRKANSWDPDTQLMSNDELWLKALGQGNHLKKEFGYRKALENALSELDEEAAETVRGFYDGYMGYAWREFFERDHPEHATDVGFYQYFMEQFRQRNGLIYRCMELAIKEHHGKGWNETDQFDYYRIAEYHYFYFDLCGPHGNRDFGRLRRGVKEWLEGKDDEECCELARDMLEKVRFFSQHIYNDEAVFGSNVDHFTIEDKRWLRGSVEDFRPKSDSEVLRLFRDFLFLLQEVCRIWAARLLRYHNTDLHELEKRVYSFLRPYTPKEDGFDYLHYVDHYYIEDNPNTCCVKNRQKAKELLYSLYDIKEGDNLEQSSDIAEQPKQEGNNTKETRNERKGGNGKPPKVAGRKPKTFQEFLKADAPEGLMDVLHEMLAGKTGGKAFPIILAITNVYTDGEPTAESVVKEFKVTKTPYRKAKRKHEGFITHKKDGDGKKKSIVEDPQPVPEDTLRKIREEIKNKLSEKAKKAQK